MGWGNGEFKRSGDFQGNQGLYNGSMDWQGMDGMEGMEGSGLIEELKVVLIGLHMMYMIFM